MKTKPLNAETIGAARSGTARQKSNPRTNQARTRFKFDLRLDDPDILASIMEMVMDKIAGLNRGVLIESCELKLFALPSFRREKVARLTVCCQGSQYTSVMNSPRWDNAFLNAFDGVCGKLRG
jgi:hypothetical protein